MRQLPHWKWPLHSECVTVLIHSKWWEHAGWTGFTLSRGTEVVHCSGNMTIGGSRLEWWVFSSVFYAMRQVAQTATRVCPAISPGSRAKSPPTLQDLSTLEAVGSFLSQFLCSLLSHCLDWCFSSGDFPWTSPEHSCLSCFFNKLADSDIILFKRTDGQTDGGTDDRMFAFKQARAIKCWLLL